MWVSVHVSKKKKSGQSTTFLTGFFLTHTLTHTFFFNLVNQLYIFLTGFTHLLANSKVFDILDAPFQS